MAAAERRRRSPLLRSIFVIFSKEVVDNGRDRRSLLVAFIYPMLGPLLLGAIISAVANVITASPGQNLILHIQGAANGPALVSFLRGKGVQLSPAPNDINEAVRTGAVDNVLIIPSGHKEEFSAQRTASIKFVVNSSRLPGLIALNRVSGLLGEFNRSTWGKRIRSRGVDYQVFRPLKIDHVNVSSGRQIFEILLFMVPPLFIFNLFMGGVYLSVDATSGERERGALEPLLINPVERWGFMMGKFLAATYYTGLAVIVQLLAFKVVFMMVGPSIEAFGNTLEWGTVLLVLAVSIPLMMFAVGVQFIIAALTRSYKEAQTYLGLLPLVPGIPGMVMVFAPVQAQDWMMSVPILSQTLLVGQLVRSEIVPMQDILTSMGSSLIYAVVLLLICARLYEREKLITGG